MAREEPRKGAFYEEREPRVFVPTAATVGPWDPRLQHGSPPAALLGASLESVSARKGARIAYFSLDFLGPVPLAPMRVEASVIRGGRKIELLSATALIDERPVLRASAWRVAATFGRAPAVRMDEAPPPMPAAAVKEYFAGVPRFGYGDALEWRFAEGGFAELGPATVWARLLGEVVRGASPSPLAQILSVVDSANGISAELDVTKYLFVPVNLTVSLTRYPGPNGGEGASSEAPGSSDALWIGMSATTSIGPDGVGTTRARLFDEAGFLGEALQTLFIEPRA
jgi:hypothetical protein